MFVGRMSEERRLWYRRLGEVDVPRVREHELLHPRVGAVVEEVVLREHEDLWSGGRGAEWELSGG